MSKPKAENLMRTNLITIGCFEPLEKAHRLLIENRIRHLPVVNGDGFVIGILSDRDLLRGSVPTFGKFGALSKELSFIGGAEVMDYMSTTLRTIPIDGGVQDAIELMLQEKLSSCLVVDGANVVGIITYEDLLEMLKSYLNRPAGGLRATISGLIASSPLGTVSSVLANSGI